MTLYSDSILGECSWESRVSLPIVKYFTSVAHWKKKKISSNLIYQLYEKTGTVQDS